MKHRIKHNQLGRNTNQVKALYRGLLSAVLQKGRVETTLAKAKAVIGDIDKIINLGKRDDITARRLIVKILGNDLLLDKVFTEVSPRMSNRQSGYSRIIKSGPRLSDNTEMAYLELVEGVEVPPQAAKEIDKTSEIKDKSSETKVKKGQDGNQKTKIKSKKTVKKSAKK